MGCTNVRLLPAETDSSALLRPFADIRLVAVDLDGTLLRPNEHVPWKILESRVRQLRQRRVRFTVATGRTMAGAQPALQRLHLSRSTPIVLYNGSVVVRCGTGEALLHRTIPVHTVRQVVAAAADAGAVALTYRFVDDPLNFLRERVEGWSANIGPTHEANGLPVTWHDPDETQPETDMTAIVVATDFIGDRRLLSKRLSGIHSVSLTTSGTDYIEVRPLGSNKAEALALISAYLKIGREEVLAVGDNDNDAEMLRWAGIGVAVRDASPLAMEAADFVSRHSDASGVNETLHVVRSALRYFG
jgi:Cof subfamily protein (haloacid dehalogenase superfamily)